MSAVLSGPMTQMMNAMQGLMNMPGAQFEPYVEHTFADGVYCRTMYIPKGVIVFGKIHKRETLNICAQGDISVVTEKGMSRFRAPMVVVSAPGVMKVGYAHEDTVWINVHPTQERDLAVIESIFIAKDFNDPELQNLMQQAAALEGT